MKSVARFFQHWPKETTLRGLTPAIQTVLIYDRVLEEAVTNHFGFISHRIALDGGESAKTIENFSTLTKDILPRVAGFAPSEIALIALGGGSIGDLVGFVASVLKRGVRLVHIPSTYLAAIDSAHGGKTALNLAEFKNQIGTFYPAEFTLCIRPLLEGQPEINLRSGYGELIKMALISGGQMFSRLEKAASFDHDLMWSLLPLAIAAKKKIVARDPFEKKGVRQFLNLGHTLGHAFELEQSLPHGLAVQHGLDFSLEWSHKLGLMNERDFLKSKGVLAKNIASKPGQMKSETLATLLRQDKKVTKSSRLKFVLLKRPGRPLIKELNVDQIVAAAIEMDWAQ